MPDIERLVEASPPWSRTLERAIFDTDLPAEVAGRIRSFITDTFGEVGDTIFYSVALGSSSVSNSPTDPASFSRSTDTTHRSLDFKPSIAYSGTCRKTAYQRLVRSWDQPS